MSSTLIDDSSLRRSLPNVSHMENSQIIEQKLQIEGLHIELSSAHAEIVKLNTENSDLKRQTDDLKKKINIYTKLLNEEPTKFTTPSKDYGSNSPMRNSDLEIKLSEAYKKIQILENEIKKMERINKQLQIKLSKTLKTNIEIKR
jgi:predicted RNase H-like nuclease (RuvC/YqgF family)